MRTSYLIVLFLLLTITTIGQNKEKIKGSKAVIEIPKEVEDFNTLEVEDNLTVYLEKGPKNEIRIEADDNLHKIILFDLKEKTLRIYTSKEIIGFKKLNIRVKYTDDLKSVIAKNATIINASEPIDLNDITFYSNDYAKLFLNVNSKKFTLKSNDKSKIELNLKSDKAKIEMSKNSQIKALIATEDLTFDMYQKSIAVIEGEAANAMLRLDNNADLTGIKFNIKKADLTAESNAFCSILAETSIIIDATDKSEIQLHGTPKIEIRKFLEEAQLIKKLN